MSYETDGTSPNPGPEAPPDANVNAVAAAQPAPDLGPAPVATATQAPPAAPAPPEKAGLWKRVLTGALAGLEMGGPAGALMGAGDPAAATAAKQRAIATANARRDEAQMKPQMESAQAASFLSDALLRQATIDQMPAELKLKQQEQELKGAEFLINHGLVPIATPGTSSQAAMATLKSVADGNGGKVPPVVTFHVGDGVLSFRMNDLGKNVGVMNAVNLMQRLRLGPQFSGEDWFNPKSPNITPTMKNQLGKDASHFFYPIGKNRDENNNLKTEYEGYLKTAQSWPDSDPDKAETVTKLEAAVDRLGSNYTKNKTDRMDEIVTGARERAKAYNGSKAVQVVDETGTLRYAPAAEAEANGWAPAAQGSTALAKQAQLNEMEQWTDRGVAVIKALPPTLDNETIARLTMATRTTDQHVIDQIKDSLATKSLSPQEQDFAVWYTNEAERILSLRNVAGQGRGSDQMRAALQAVLPAAKSGNQQLMLKQLGAVKNQMTLLHAGIAKVKGNTATSAPAAAPAASATPQSHSFSLSAWQRANPGGNVAAARAAAEAQHFQVVQ